MAYIDSEMAKRRSEGLVKGPPKSNLSTTSRTNFEEAEKIKSDGTQRQPATIGKLLEIDLGEDARALTAARTEQARRRMAGEEVAEETTGPPRKVRLGKDGKPWRGRKRRNSEDVKRDAFVEAVMRENRRECTQILLLFGTLSSEGSRRLNTELMKL